MGVTSSTGSRDVGGLIHPRSLERWHEWEKSRHLARRTKHALIAAPRSVRAALRREAAPPSAVQRFQLLSRSGQGPRALIAVDSASPTSRASLLAALPYQRTPVDVLVPQGLALVETSGPDWTAGDCADPMRDLAERGITVVLSLGQHLPAGRMAHRFAEAQGLRSVVVQHGALTPFAPPLPPQTTLLAWSAADGEFWRSGRRDIEVAPVGSQLLWQARHETAQDAASLAERPVFLGQLHGAELSRRLTGGAAFSFCRRTGAQYRPHPSETDALSRLTHGLWRRRGMEFVPTDVPLRDLARPVVAVFSTGVLEAAVRGMPAWVYAPRAPRWVHEFWDRYGMRRYLVGGTGPGAPTPAPEMPAGEPAARLAELLEADA